MNLDKAVKKVMFIASEGGHLAQLLQLKPLFPLYDSYLVTEKDEATVDLIGRYHDLAHVFYLPPVRKTNFIKYNFQRLRLLFSSIFLYLKIRPDFVVSTGSITGVFMCYLAHLFHKKVIYFETFASIKKPSHAGKLVYKFADRFYVQWEEMKKFYPNAIFIGSLY